METIVTVISVATVLGSLIITVIVLSMDVRDWYRRQ